MIGSKYKEPSLRRETCTKRNKLNETAVAFYFQAQNKRLQSNLTATSDSETKAQIWCQFF